MANIKQAAKRAKQAEKRRQNNRWQKTRAFTQIKVVLAAIEAGDHGKATEEYRTMSSFIDKLARKGIIHKNKAARHKSRLNAHIKALAPAAA